MRKRRKNPDRVINHASINVQRLGGLFVADIDPIFLSIYTDLDEESYKELGYRLILWSKRTYSIDIESFCYEWLLSLDELIKLTEKNKHLAECYKIVLGKLLEKRLALVMERKMPSNVFIATLPLYSPQFADFLLKKQKTNDSDQAVKLIINEIKSSSLVPEKKEDNGL